MGLNEELRIEEAGCSVERSARDGRVDFVGSSDGVPIAPSGEKDGMLGRPYSRGKQSDDLLRCKAGRISEPCENGVDGVCESCRESHPLGMPWGNALGSPNGSGIVLSGAG